MFGINTEWYFKPIAMVVGQVLIACYTKPTWRPRATSHYSQAIRKYSYRHSKVRYQVFRRLYDSRLLASWVGGPSTRWQRQGLIFYSEAGNPANSSNQNPAKHDSGRNEKIASARCSIEVHQEATSETSTQPLEAKANS
ncbi:hypothetical protein O9993_20580 [Vibrio lentus]|nr:hypothetical protein [Vibrio lentus]